MSKRLNFDEWRIKDVQSILYYSLFVSFSELASDSELASIFLQLCSAVAQSCVPVNRNDLWNWGIYDTPWVEYIACTPIHTITIQGYLAELVIGWFALVRRDLCITDLRMHVIRLKVEWFMWQWAMGLRMNVIRLKVEWFMWRWAMGLRMNVIRLKVEWFMWRWAIGLRMHVFRLKVEWFMWRWAMGLRMNVVRLKVEWFIWWWAMGLGCSFDKVPKETTWWTVVGIIRRTILIHTYGNLNTGIVAFTFTDASIFTLFCNCRQLNDKVFIVCVISIFTLARLFLLRQGYAP